MSTPEGKVKAAINKVLKKFDLYKFMPVPSGYGISSLDYLLCVNGLFVAIEAKARGKKPTARQELTIAEIRAAGGAVFIIDGPEGVAQLEAFVTQVTTKGNAHDTHNQPQAQGGRSARHCGHRKSVSASKHRSDRRRAPSRRATRTRRNNLAA